MDPGAGLWDIPGGFLEEQEDPVDGLRREFLEETGLSIHVESLLGIWIESYGERFVSCATWVVRPNDGTPAPGDDLVHLEWFNPDELPAPTDYAFATHVEILDVWLAGRRTRTDP
jgi:ADP-ribose pyrophosphatase YjhB (NUDIX family)